jgi:hypothetical protein
MLAALAAAWLPAAFATPAADGLQAPSLVVVSDPQIHNVAGGDVKQTFLISDWATHVAQRYPEINLLAPYVFDALVQRAEQEPLGQDTGLVLLLGDGTNASCTGEFDRLKKHLAAIRGDNGDRIVLWAHGNHDSYLMGTTNSYVPTDEDTVALEEMAGSSQPVDKSWWKPLDEPLDRRKAWNSVCADGHGGVPMNKGQWIARYLASFGEKNLARSSRTVDEEYIIDAHGTPGSRLAALDFQVLGRWVPPALSPRGKWDLKRSYLSYIVQAIDVGDSHRLILIDTSVCNDTGRGPSYIWKNAGTHACVPRKELEDIAALAKATNRRLIFAGHYPLAKLGARDRADLLAVFNAGDRPWSYMSGHTHAPESWQVEAKDGSYAAAEGSTRYDLNVGSTTDWPMEAHRVAFTRTEQGMIARSVGFLGAPRLARYKAPPNYQGWEICRHLKVAQALAEVPAGKQYAGPWKPAVAPADYATCRKQEYTTSVAQLDAAMNTIEANMADPDYRDAMMRIAVSASRAENKQNWAGKYIRELP